MAIINFSGSILSTLPAADVVDETIAARAIERAAKLAERDALAWRALNHYSASRQR